MTSFLSRSHGKSFPAFLFFVLLFSSVLLNIADAAALPQDEPEDTDLPPVNLNQDLTTDAPLNVVDDDGQNEVLPETKVIEINADVLDSNTVPPTVATQVNATVPEIAKDLGLSGQDLAAANAEVGPELETALKEFFEDDGAPAKRDEDAIEERSNDLQERGLKAKIKCKIIALCLRPLFLISAKRFDKKNNGPGVGIKQDQKFFLFALHRTLFEGNDKVNVRIWYKANWVLARFWHSDGVTFGKKIYIRKRYESYKQNKSAFWPQVKLLAHELEHVKQYRQHNWSLRKFAKEYLYRWCRAGKSYWNNSMERSARNAADKIDRLLGASGQVFFRYWHRDNLVKKLGYPVETTYHDIGNGRKELRFQKGLMQTRDNKCYRRKTNGGWNNWDCS